MERRVALQKFSALWAEARLAIGALATRRSTCGDFGPLGRASGRSRRTRRTRHPRPGGSSRRLLRLRRVQPFRAAGRNAGGRLCGTSRAHACEARARAPRSPERVAPCRPRPDWAPNLRRLPVGLLHLRIAS